MTPGMVESLPMNRLLLSSAALALIAAPSLANAKTHHTGAAKHKVAAHQVVKTKTTKTK